MQCCFLLEIQSNLSVCHQVDSIRNSYINSEVYVYCALYETGLITHPFEDALTRGQVKIGTEIADDLTKTVASSVKGHGVRAHRIRVASWSAWTARTLS